MSADPFVAIWLDTRQDRSQRVVLEANTDHWNHERGPRLEKVVFRNDLTPQEALRLVCDSEGDVDIVTEVSPADADRVKSSQYAHLVGTDAMRVLLGIINRDAAPFHDVRARKALNLAVDRHRLINDGLKGLAAQHSFVEKVIPAPFDVLLFAWFDLSSDAPGSCTAGCTTRWVRFARAHRSRSSSGCWRRTLGRRTVGSSTSLTRTWTDSRMSRPCPCSSARPRPCTR